MQYRNTIEAIYAELNEVLQMVANMGADETIPAIELDLAMEKMRRTYDLLYQIKSVAGEATQPVVPKAPKVVQKEKTKVEQKTEVVAEVKEEVVFELEESVREETVTQPSAKKEASEIAKKIKDEVQRESKKEQEESVTLSDKFNDERGILNEELESKVNKDDLSSRLSSAPISDLNKAIGINEKFEFINNLFNGDKASFDKTIEMLNMATNFNEAYNYLNTTFKWDMDNTYAQRLLELIRRKLIVNHK